MRRRFTLIESFGRLRAHSFTLIELLVVIAIIAILASLLLPALATAKEKGRESVCTGNLKQMGMAMLSYVHDYDEKFPRNAVFNPSLNVYEAWIDKAVAPYIDTPDIKTCPTSKRRYGYSQYIGREYTTEPYTCASYATIVKPSQTVVLLDAYDRCPLPSSWRRPTVEPRGTAYGAITAACGWRTPTAPHNRGGGFLFIDGHKERLTAQFNVYQPGTAFAPEIPTPDYRAYEGGPKDIWLTGNK